MKMAQPKPIEAVTAIWPTRLKHPVKQPHPVPPPAPSHDDKQAPTAVGYVEAISPSASETKTHKSPTISHPHVITTGPPWLNAIVYDVRHPARIEMIVNEIAKFWNPPIDLNSSWA